MLCLQQNAIKNFQVDAEITIDAVKVPGGKGCLLEIF
jgi:hypothetical protein